MMFNYDIVIVFLYLMAVITWTVEMCRCGYGSYCGLFQNDENLEDCLCELSEGLYEPEQQPGEGCSVLQDHCLSNPCQNGGICFPTFGSYNCICDEQYYGQACQLNKATTNASKTVKNIMAFFNINEQLFRRSIRFYTIFEEMGSNFSLLVDDGNGFIQTERDIEMKRMDPNELCMSLMTNSSEADPRICQLIARKKMMFVGESELKYPVVNKEHRNFKCNKRNRTIGRLDKVTLSVNSSGKPVFFSTYNVFTYFTSETAACTPLVQLKQCSADMRKPVIYSRSSIILIRAVTEPALRKYPCTFITSVKHTWKIIGRNVQKTFEGDSILRLDGGSLDFDTYMVEYSIDLFGAPEIGLERRHYVNFQRCWFKVEAKPVVAVIRGGRSRTYPRGAAIKLVSESYDPNNVDNSQLSYRWTCDNIRQSFCSASHEISSSSVFIVRNLRRTITFTLKTWLPELGIHFASEAKQTIKISSSSLILHFYIRCTQNCLNTNPSEDTILELQNYPPTGTVSWSYSVDGGQSLPLDGIRQGGTPHYQAIIKRGALQHNKVYTITVSHGENENIFEIKTMAAPGNGRCTSNPTSGEAGLTSFTIECLDYSPMDSAFGPLTYRVYESQPGFNDILVASSTDNVIRNLHFSNGNIKIKIVNRFGSSVEENLAVTLSSTTSLDNSDVEVLEKKILAYLVGRDTNNALSVINFIASKFDMENNIEIIDRLITKISEVELHEISDITSASGTLAHVLSKVNGEKITSGMVKRISATLHNFSSGILSKSVNTSDFLMDDLVSLSNFILGSIDPLLSSRDTRLTKHFLSPAKEYEKSYINYRDGCRKILSCLEELGGFLLQRLEPHQESIRLTKNRDIKMETKVSSVKELSLDKIDPSGEGMSWIEFDDVFRSKYEGEIIEVQVTEFKKTPAWWKETSLHLNTNDLDIKIKLRRENDSIPIRRLKAPLRIAFQAPDVPSKTLSGTVVQPEDSLSKFDKDSYVAIHKIDRPMQGNAAIAFDFLGMSSEEFHVIMTINLIPDFDLLRHEGEIVSSTNHIYIGKLSGNDADIIYLGILPTAKHPSGTQLSYSFNALDSICRVWTGENWDIGQCNVSSSNGNKILCECQHLSLFGGSLLVPPVAVHPISDIKLFKTVPSNPYVLILVSLLLIIYVGLLIWADKMDRKDSRERGIIVLQDNFPGDQFGYLLAVFTSEGANSGTSANVGVRLIGTKAQSHPHILNHNKNLLQLGQDNWFLLYTEKHLGKILNLHVWHDNTGPHPDWFCTKMMVYDLASDEQYLFPVDRWLSVSTVDPNDWKLEMMLVPEKHGTLGWQSLAKENFFAGLRESHIWFSIFVRHPRSSYTRRQRLTIALIIILISMLSSIMFYGAVDAAVEDDPTYDVGIRELTVVLQATLISIVVSVVAAKLFTLSWPEKVYEQPPKTATKRKKYPWYSPTAMRRCLSKVQDNIGQLILGFLIMDPLLPVQLDSEQPLTADKKKKRRAFLILAWVVNICIILVCSYFLVLYGLKLGPNKSLIWASVVMFNIGKAIFLTQPLKVIFLSLLVAIFLKMENRDKLTFEVDPVSVDENLKDNPQFMSEFLELRSQPMYHPLAEIDVMIAHQTRKNVERHKWDNMNFLFVSVIYVFLIIIVLSICSNTSPQEIKHIMEMMKGETTAKKTELNDVTSNKKFVQYLVDSLIPSLHKTKLYNEDPLPREEREEGESDNQMKGWVSDYMNKLIGVPRLRQLRVMEGSCSVAGDFKEWFSTCNSTLSLANTDTHAYGVGWVKDQQHDWVYKGQTQSESLDLHGASGYYYQGGGYIQNLSSNSWNSIRKITSLNITQWFDHRTRLVVLEFSLFNIHSSIFSIVSLIAENLANGVYTTRIYVDSAFHEFYMEDFDAKLVTVLCFLVIILVLSIIRIIIHVSVKGMAVYFKEWGHLLDFLIIFFGFTSIIAAVIRSMYFKTYSNIFRRPATHDIFVSFSYPFYQDDLTSVLICFFIICTTIRFCILCNYGKHFLVLKKTIFAGTKFIFCILLLTLVSVSLLAVLMYSCGKQTSVLFPALPVPRIRFKNLENIENAGKLYSVLVNFLYLFSGIMVTCVFIYYYGKAKQQIVWFGVGLKGTNRFRDMYDGAVEELRSVLGAVKGKKNLRLKGGGNRLPEGEGMNWDLRARRLMPREWGIENCHVWREPIIARETFTEATQQLHDWFNTRTKQYEKMSKQLDIISELLDYDIQR